MTNYVKSTNFASKDSLATGNPLKIVKGTEIDTEFNNISTAVATKADSSSPSLSNASLTGSSTSVTPSNSSNDTSIATTAFVNNVRSTDFGGIGSYAVLQNASNSNIAVGGTILGANLRYLYSVSGSTSYGGSPFCGYFSQNGNSTYGGGGTALSGTWRKMSSGDTFDTFQLNPGDPINYIWIPALYVRIS